MKAIYVFLFVICLNLATMIIYEVNAVPTASLPSNYTSPSVLQTLFSIENYRLTDWLVLGGGGVFAVLMTLVTKQYLAGTSIILVWILSGLVGPIGWIVNGFPKLVGEVILTVGEHSVEAVALSGLISTVLTALVVFVMFAFVLEIAGQRSVA